MIGEVFGSGMTQQFTLQDNLLATKLQTPVLRPLIVQRPRLIDSLWTGMQCKLTQVVAPAGYGKTTLLGEWQSALSKIGWKTAWVSLDQGDNSPVRFWAYILAALQTVNPEWSINTLETWMDDDQPVYAPIISLLNQIAAHPSSFSLILDDYHVIKNESIHKAMAFLIMNMPENMHVVIASRETLRLPVAELRAKNQLHEIRAENLIFTITESKTFFQHVMGLELTNEEVVELVQQTEGWITGLQLAAIWMKDMPDHQQFLKQFGASQRHIFDYLTEVVLEKQPRDVQEFLLKTSIFGALSAPLCDAVLGVKNSIKYLEYIEQANLFIVPLDEHRCWYRYHALLSDFLRLRLEREEPELVPRLHLAACRWLNQNGYSELSVRHALAAGETELAADIVESCALSAIIQMDLARVFQWFNQLPGEIVNNRPRLMIYYALANLMLGKTDDVIHRIDRVKEKLRQAAIGEISQAETSKLKRYAKAVRAATECVTTGSSESIIKSQQVIGNLPVEDNFFLGLVEHYLAYAYQKMGRLSEGVEAQERACQNAIANGFHKEFVLSKSEKARFLRLQGKYRAAAEAYQQAIDYAEKQGVGLDIRVIPKAGLGTILCEWNRVSEAEDLFKEPVQYYLESPPPPVEWFYSIDACLAVARKRLKVGDIKAAVRCIERARHQGQVYQYLPGLASEFLPVQVDLWRAEEDSESAEEWLRRKSTCIEDDNSSFDIIDQMALAKVNFMLGNIERADSILEKLQARLEGSEFGEYLLGVFILRALLLSEKGLQADSLEVLNRALVLAEPDGWISSFLQYGEAMKRLIQEMIKNTKTDTSEPVTRPSQTYLLRILDQFNRSAGTTRDKVRPAVQAVHVIAPLHGSLSDREMEVLSLLSKGYTEGDIARELVISRNTSKAHIKSIYRKLDVHTRKDAVERAIKLNLVI